ncbi:MAG: hypothetical protein ABI137_09205, partial [Antricoccus sp.]
MLVLTRGSAPDDAVEQFSQAMQALGPGDRRYAGVVVINERLESYGPVHAVTFTPEGMAVIGVQQVNGTPGYLFAPHRGAWTVGGQMAQLQGVGSNPIGQVDGAVKAIAQLVLRGGIDPGYVQSLIAVTGSVSGVAQPENERSSGVIVVRLVEADLIDGISRATTQTGGGLKQLWTSADLLAALRILGFDTTAIPVEAVTNEGFPYSPYVLRGTAADPAVVGAGHYSASALTDTAPRERVVALPRPLSVQVPSHESEKLQSSAGAADIFDEAGAEVRDGGSPLKWLAGAAVLLVIALLVILGGRALFASSSSSNSVSAPADSGSASAKSPTSGAASAAASNGPQKSGDLAYNQGAFDQTDKCATFAFGKVQAFLQQQGCATLTRGLYLTEANGKQIVVAAADIAMDSADAATKLKSLVDTDGTGNVNNLLLDGKIPAGYPAASVMKGSSYASSIKGNVVRVVAAAYADGS